MSEPIKVEGLREFNRALKKMDSDLPKAVRLAFNEAADLIVQDARPNVPVRSGRARSTVKARSTRTAARVVGGGNRAPYYPWLDFGGRVGRRKSVRRPFLKDGRYIYAAYDRRKGEFIDVMAQKLVDLAEGAGIEVT